MNATTGIHRNQATCLAIFACSMALGPAALGAEAGLPGGEEIIQNVNARDDGEAVTRRLTMTMTDRRGKQRVRETFGYRKYFGDEKRTVIFFLSPSNIRDTSFLTFDYFDPDRDDDQWLYLPAARKVRRISSADRGDYFLGTDFTYDDMKNETKISVRDYNRTTVGQEEVDGHPCYIVESIPVDEKTSKELGYGKVRAWIDADIWMTRKVEYWDIRGNPLKAMHSRDIREVDGIWTSHDLTIKNHKTGHTTHFKFAEVDYEAPVDDDVFTERALRRGVRTK